MSRKAILKMKIQNQITSDENITNRIFEDSVYGQDFFTEIYRQLELLEVSIDDLDNANIDFILAEEFGLNIDALTEENYDIDFSRSLVRYFYSALDLGYRRYLEIKKG